MSSAVNSPATKKGWNKAPLLWRCAFSNPFVSRRRWIKDGIKVYPSTSGLTTIQ
jgi:hypothetical protein